MGLKRTTVYLPEEVHRALRLRASEVGTTLSALVVRALGGLLGQTAQASALAEPVPDYDPALSDSRVGLGPEDPPRGLLAAVGAWEGVQGLDELDRILAQVRLQNRDRDVDPLDR